MSSVPGRRILPMADAAKVYCSCGSIVDLDGAAIRLKRVLGKDVECMSCRNLRISCDIELMDRHFSGVQEEDPWLLS